MNRVTRPAGITKRLWLILALLMFAALAWVGISGGIKAIPRSESVGQRIQAYSQLVYGSLSACICLTALWLTRLAAFVRASWLLVIAISGGLAPVVWGGSGIAIGLISGVSSLLVGWGVIALLRFAERSAAPRR